MSVITCCSFSGDSSQDNNSTVDTNGADSRNSIVLSPSTSPFNGKSLQQQQTNPTSRATSSLSTRSADSDDGCTTRQSCGNDKFAGKSEDAEPKCDSANRCIAGIFGAHGKLKRLLGTLVHFAMDISPDTGDTVRSLVLGLLVSWLRMIPFFT